MIDKLEQYLINHLWALDRWGNVWLGGSSKEFISTRIYHHKDDSRICGFFYRLLNSIDRNHGEKAAHRDLAPPDLKEDILA